MTPNFLEQLIAEWYEYRHWFVWTNVKKRGNPCEMHVIAFCPRGTKELIHFEAADRPADDALRQEMLRKFLVAQELYPMLFPFVEPKQIQRIAVFGFSRHAEDTFLADGIIERPIPRLLKDIVDDLNHPDISIHAVPEKWPILRGMEYALWHLNPQR